MQGGTCAASMSLLCWQHWPQSHSISPLQQSSTHTQRARIQGLGQPHAPYSYSLLKLDNNPTFSVFAYTITRVWICVPAVQGCALMGRASVDWQRAPSRREYYQSRPHLWGRRHQPPSLSIRLLNGGTSKRAPVQRDASRFTCMGLRRRFPCCGVGERVSSRTWAYD